MTDAALTWRGFLACALLRGAAMNGGFSSLAPLRTEAATLWPTCLHLHSCVLCLRASLARLERRSRWWHIGLPASGTKARLLLLKHGRVQMPAGVCSWGWQPLPLHPGLFCTALRGSSIAEGRQPQVTTQECAVGEHVILHAYVPDLLPRSSRGTAIVQGCRRTLS